jgi:type II secretory pathway component PulF
MAGQVTGLSADALEYILLALSLAYTTVAFFEWRAGKDTRLKRVLSTVLLVIPVIESWVRRYRKKRK